MGALCGSRRCPVSLYERPDMTARNCDAALANFARRSIRAGERKKPGSCCCVAAEHRDNGERSHWALVRELHPVGILRWATPSDVESVA
jgi:hypothetical protein